MQVGSLFRNHGEIIEKALSPMRDELERGGIRNIEPIKATFAGKKVN